MSDPRMTGLSLMGLAIAAFLGSTSELLPAVTFFPALVLFAIGAVKFMKTNSVAMAEAEKKVERRVNPTIRQNVHAQAQAERLAAKRGGTLNSLSEDGLDAERAARLASGASAAEAVHTNDAIDFDGGDEDDLVVTTDVSFPVEVQQGDALADQLKKLNTLMAQGVLTEEEYAVAKAKLLG